MSRMSGVGYKRKSQRAGSTSALALSLTSSFDPLQKWSPLKLGIVDALK